MEIKDYLKKLFQRVEYAIRLLEKLTAQMELYEKVSFSRDDLNHVYNIINEYEDGVSHSFLITRTQSMTKDERNMILNTLVEERRIYIEEENISGSTRKSKVYYTFDEKEVKGEEDNDILPGYVEGSDSTFT